MRILALLCVMSLLAMMVEAQAQPWDEHRKKRNEAEETKDEEEIYEVNDEITG